MGISAILLLTFVVADLAWRHRTKKPKPVQTFKVTLKLPAHAAKMLVDEGLTDDLKLQAWPLEIQSVKLTTWRDRLQGFLQRKIL